MKVFAFFGHLFLQYPLILLGALLVINLIALAFYVADKKKAQKGSWRIPEATLVGLAWAFGSVGALIGMYVYRHKTKHIKFMLGIPLIIVAQAVIVFLLFYFKVF